MESKFTYASLYVKFTLSRGCSGTQGKGETLKVLSYIWDWPWPEAALERKATGVPDGVLLMLLWYILSAEPCREILDTFSPLNLVQRQLWNARWFGHWVTTQIPQSADRCGLLPQLHYQKYTVKAKRKWDTKTPRNHYQDSTYLFTYVRICVHIYII